MSTNSMEDYIAHLDELLTVFFLEKTCPNQEVSPDTLEKLYGILLKSQKQLENLSETKLENFITTLERQLPEFKGVLAARASFAYLLVSRLKTDLQLSPDLIQALSGLNNLLIAEALKSPSFWVDDHPLKTAYNCIHNSLIGWSEQGGPQACQLLEAVNSTISTFQAAAGNEAIINQSLSDYQAAVSSTAEKIEKLSERVRQSELGQIKNVVATNLVTGFINEKSRQRELPENLLRILSEELVNELKIDIINQGEESPVWIRFQKLWPHFFSFYKWINNPERDESKRNEITRFFHNWSKFLLEEVNQDDRFSEVIVKMEFDLVQSGMGVVENTMLPYPVIENPFGDSLAVKTVSSSLMDEAMSFSEGDWFLVAEQSGELHRYRLLAFLPEYNHIMFVYFSGQKAATLTYDDFAYFLSTGKYAPLVETDILAHIFKNEVSPLEEKFEEVRETKQKEQERLELERRRAIEEQERRLAAEKAEREAAELAERQAAEEQRRKMEKMTSDLKRHARLALDSMTLGSWIEFREAQSEEYRHAKLAVKMLASNKFVFVDEDGNTLLEAVRDDLVDMLLKKNLKLSESDINFSEKLTELIKGASDY